jgi:hypothetical protein
MESVRQWWAATKTLSPLEARSYLISRVQYRQARPMIVLLHAEDRTPRVMEHLREFLVSPSGELQFNVAGELAGLGDLMGITLVVEGLHGRNKIAREESRLLVRYGGRRAYGLLRKMLEDDLAQNGSAGNSASKTILRTVVEEDEGPMTIPLLAVALDPEDDVVLDGAIRPSFDLLLPQSPTRADVAAAAVQQLTRRDFRYDPAARPELRRKAITRIRDWWDREGRGLYEFESPTVRRGGAIR